MARRSTGTFRVLVTIEVGGVVMLYAVWRLMIVRTLNDEARQRVFAYRHQLFDLVCEGKIAPTDPAYIDARNAINGILFMMDGFSLTRIGAALTAKREPRRAPRAANPDAQMVIDRVLTRTVSIAIRRAVFTSIPALMIAGTIAIIYWLKRTSLVDQTRDVLIHQATIRGAHSA